MPRKRTPVGILHHGSDWILLADLNKTYCFPVQIAFTQLRPDIKIFSNSLRKVILIELTYPCEENKEWASAAKCKLNYSSKETYNLESSMSPFKQTTKPGSNAKSL